MSASKVTQCQNCAHNMMRHVRDTARYPLSPCNVTACICTQYRPVTVVRRRQKVGAR